MPKRKTRTYTILILTVLAVSTAMSPRAQDATPSIRALGLYYNSGAYTDAQAQTMAERYDMAILDGDGFATTYYQRMVNALRAQKPNSIILIYNSTDLAKRNNSKSNSYEWDSLMAYAGGYPHQFFYHCTDQQLMTYADDVLLPGLNNDPDSSKSEIGWFIGYSDRRHPNFRDPQVRRWQVRFNKSVLQNTVPGTNHYPDGIWWDNCGVDISNKIKESDSPFSGVPELGGRRWWYGQAWYPSREFPNADTSGLRLRWEGLAQMLKEQMDTLRNSAAWHPTGRKLYHATNWAEVRFDVDWSPYMWREQMYDSNYTKYAYMEHTPNPLREAVFLSPGASNSASSISTSYWGAKGPIAYFEHDTIATRQGVCVIYHPGFPYSSQYKPYGIANRLYSDLAVYYLIRTDSTYWKIHAYNGQANVGGGSGIAPGSSDSVMWVDAYGYDFSPSFPMDSTPYAYASSVSCTDCDGRMQHDGLGKDGVGQNWVVFRRNMPNGNMVLHRAVPASGTTTGNSTYTPYVPLGGQYRKLGIDGTLGPIITSDRFRNGEGGVYVYAGAVNNTPPSTPFPSAPTGGATTSTSPTLVTNASIDPDDNSLTYTFQVSNFQNFSSVTATGQVNGGVTGQISWQVTPSLQASTNYWWRVKAADYLQSSGWSAAQAFQTDIAANSAPSTPVPASPPNGGTVTQASPTLVINNSSDVDGDNLTYSFELYNAAGTSLLSSANSITPGAGQTQWTVPLTISDGTTCSWRARAFDGELYSGWSSLRSFTVSLSSGGNTPPSLPVPLTPQPSDTMVGEDITFIWQNSYDPDGDQLGYDIWIEIDSAGADVDSARNIFQPPTGSTTSHTFSNIIDKLSNGATYWWRLRANDGSDWTQKSVPQPFVYYDFSLGTDAGQATTASPPPNAVVRSSRPTLVATNITLPGDNRYYFEVATDSSFVNLIGASGALPEGPNNQTAWTLDVALEPEVTYYWRVKANDNAYSVVAMFTIELSPHASPSPFRPAEHSFTTFHDIPEGATLTLMTVNGSIVARWNNIVGGTWYWDGTNQAGQPVSSGVYLWFIEGSQLKGKLVLQR